MISIIIPIYNVEGYLSRCIDSVLNQTYKNLEIILVDDGSPDNCGKICDEYAKKDSRIKVIHKENGGVSSARNAGLDIARGDYIGFVDPDDYIHQTMYETLISEISEDDFDIVECNYTQIYEDGSNLTRNIKDKVYSDYYDILEGGFTAYLSFVIWDKLYKKSIIDGTRFNTSFKVAEDQLFFFECAKKGAVLKSINKPLYYYYLRNDSVMRKSFHRGFFDALMVLEILRDDCKKDDKLFNYFNSYYLIKLIDFSQKQIDSGMFIEEREKMRQRIKDNIKYILKFKPTEINSTIRHIRFIHKLYSVLICICPKVLYWLYPKYLKLRNSDC